MSMNDRAVNDMNPDSDKGLVHTSGNEMHEIEGTMKVLNRVDLDLAYSTEKLVNLQVLLMHLLTREDDTERLIMGYSYISATSVTKAFELDILSGILDSELREVESLLDNLQVELVDVRHKISSCKHLRDIFTIMEEKLHDCKESLKQSQEHVLDLKMQSAKLQRIISSFKYDTSDNDDLSANGQLSNINGISKMQTADSKRYILRMLEKSLAREVDLEKKITEFDQNEEQLKLKLHHTEQVAFRMEEAAEVVWGRFLEAENAREVLMGISKELLGRFQIVQFSLNGSLQREALLKSKLEGCTEQLKAKDRALQKLDCAKNSEVLTLKEKVKSLEEQLKESEIRLQNVNASYEVNQEHLNEMENYIESLKESIYEAESRAESVEAKATQLADTNLELSEELNFLKGNNDGDAKKVGILENQLRELEIQIQYAKVSSEASQEQQNMLYSAIWDMETLIEDLKSKVSKAESKNETAEEQCIVLSEDNSKLKKELRFMSNRIRILESSLDQVNNEKVASAKEINHRAKLMRDMIMQLATQRELILKQLFSLANENKLSGEKLQYTEKISSATICDTGDDADEDLPIHEKDLFDVNMKVSGDVVSLTTSIQAGGCISQRHNSTGDRTWAFHNSNK